MTNYIHISLVCFFFNDTATTEIYTRSIVGSVRCVQETAYILPMHNCFLYNISFLRQLLLIDQFLHHKQNLLQMLFYNLIYNLHQNSEFHNFQQISQPQTFYIELLFYVIFPPFYLQIIIFLSYNFKFYINKIKSNSFLYSTQPQIQKISILVQFSHPMYLSLIHI
eukprot:TRINITY_DN54767_c0_g1_i1.p1 TRINITY_DN54767_c0_g1~~TRINITY_DN54767_c0_g1_i1.p1  ORF type:complete len:166 (+),score=0.02 TRINITY_DN54767_c0_g1_i1:63-560(+)